MIPATKRRGDAMNIRIALVCALLPVVAAPSWATGTRAYANIVNSEGQAMGRARLTGLAHGVLIEIEVHGLQPGAHAIAVHAIGACDGAGGFASAGAILGFDTMRPHGYLAKGGPRTGDLPNQYAGADGALHASVITSAFTLGTGVKSIFDADGAAIVVRAKADDYLSQPDGKAGARVACGVIRRTGEPARPSHR